MAKERKRKVKRNGKSAGAGKRMRKGKREGFHRAEGRGKGLSLIHI